MNKMITKLLSIGLILISFTLLSFGQTRQEKTIAIINKLKLIENKKQNYEFQIEALKYQATGNDSIRIIELEKQLSDDEITKKISSAFNEVFSDNEINDINNFVQTSAFDKFFNSGEAYKIIDSKFKDIDTEIEKIKNKYRKIVDEPTKKFEQIPIDRENGFYETVGYKYPTLDKDIVLKDKPSLTSKDILEVKKTFSSYNDRPEISIVFTEDGARKFYLLTKKNIGKPIAVVVEKHIVSMPIVNSEIKGGKASIIGDFSEKEINKMIETLQQEQ